MHNNRRRFVAAGAAGLTTLLVPNVAEARFCGCCQEASDRKKVEVKKTGLVVSTTPYCPMFTGFSGITLVSSGTITTPATLQRGIQYTFTFTGTNLYSTFVGSVGTPTYPPIIFIPAIADSNNNNPASVLWGSYNYGLVTQGTGGGADTFTFNASYTVPTGATPTTPGNLTITVTLYPAYYNHCSGGNSTQAVNYS